MVFYRAYYDAVGLNRGAPTLWQTYKERLAGLLVEHQHRDGWWSGPPNDNEASHGRVYTTSMALLALTVDRHVLPAYQR